MDKATFYYLHDLLQEDLEKHFFQKKEAQETSEEMLT
jgi:hypothetical protein